MARKIKEQILGYKVKAPKNERPASSGPFRITTRRGVEPRIGEPKSPVLPLHQRVSLNTFDHSQTNMSIKIQLYELLLTFLPTLSTESRKSRIAVRTDNS